MKTVLIIAAIILIIGAILVGVGCVLLQKNPPKNTNVVTVTKEYHIGEAPKQINVDSTVSCVEILPIEGDEWRVECKEKENLHHTIELANGVLTIKQIDNRRWYEHIGIFSGLQPLSIIVYLPAQTYESLCIDSTSGSIQVAENFVFSSANLKNTSGFIAMSASVEGDLTVKNTSGSITVDGNVSGNLSANNTSGSIRILGGVNGNLAVKNNSGRIEVKDATPLNVQIGNTSGGIRLENVICQGEIKVANTSGFIDLERCDALSFDLHTTSGGIRGSILTAKTFDCKSTSGGVHTPNDGNGGTFRARSTSGGINITVVE